MIADSVSRFHRFSRAVTTEVGALDDSFLGRGRPLGSARVLNAIGRGRTDVAGIRDHLGLDSGLMSRLLRALEAEGLIELDRHPDDARRRVARLTPTGRREFHGYERLSDARARRVLEGHPSPERLLEAMDLIATALSHERIAIAEADPAGEAARHCLDSCHAELARRLPQGPGVPLSRDTGTAEMTPPRGTFLVAWSDGLPVGCVGLSGAGGPIAEITRLWVSPSARGLGLAGRLMEAVEDAARALSVATLRLDAKSIHPEAVPPHDASGWTEVPRPEDDPRSGAVLEKHLGDRG